MRWGDLPGVVDIAAGQAWSERRVAVASIAWTWGVYLALMATRLTMISFPREAALLGRHGLTALSGAAITWVLRLVVRRRGPVPIAPRIGIAMILALPAAGALTLINYGALYGLAPEAIWSARVRDGVTLNGVVARTLPELYFVLAGWAALYGSVTSAIESRDAQRRAAQMQAEARKAQLRTLRYQVNPHFLFNTLNSLSALVMRDDRDGAERIIQSLSSLLRTTLVDDEAGDATLADEVALQCLYLDIEQVRFGARLRVRWVIPDALGGAELPVLLLQPLVENVLHHAVAPTSQVVTLTVAAEARRDGLHLVVEDDGPGQGTAGGTGIGLRNVASRLQVRYGEAAGCRHGPRQGGGYRVELVLPLHLRGSGA